MKRELDNFLIQWAQKKQRKPLLLRGARQTGKSYAVEKLAKSFPYFVCINFEKNPSLGKLLFRIFETAPKIIGNKVAYAKIDPDAKAQQIKRAIDLLEKAHLLKKVKSTSGAGVPLAAGASEKRYKLVFLDVGLMQRLMGVRCRDWSESNNLFSAHTGAVAEQFVGQELICLEGLNNNSDLYYWDRNTRGSTAEIDYLVAIRGKVVPLEISDHQQSWGYEDGCGKGLGLPLLEAADFKASTYQSFFFDWTGRFIGRRRG